MNTTLSKIIGSTLLATGVAFSLVAAPTQAATLGKDLCSTSNISLGGVNSTACKGSFEGNDTGSGNPLLTELNAGLFTTEFNSNQTVSWSSGGKSEAGQTGLFGFNADYDSAKGDWGFTTTPPTFNTFVVSLKSSTTYSAYLFKDYDWSKGLTGVFDTVGVSANKGKGRALSHASLFVANVTTVTPPPVEVPEPATLVGLGLAFGGMLASRRRQSH